MKTTADAPITTAECRASGVCPAGCAWSCEGEKYPHYCTLAKRELDRLNTNPNARTPYRDRLAAKAALAAGSATPTGSAENTARTPPKSIDPNAFVTTEQLTADTIAFRKTLPPDIDCVVAISRSGLLPGSIVAYDLHLPLWTVSRQTGINNPGHGGRMDGAERPEPKHILLIDDTAAHGREMTACLPIVQERFPDARITKAVIYCRPEAVGVVDMLYAVYPGSHWLEWNWQNAGHGAACIYDFDGVICRDFTAAECADMDTYRRTMETITPLYLPRRVPVPLIVTARPESTRDLTNAWLARHGVRVERLVMWPDKTHPPASEVAPWKAKHYAESGIQLFAESDPWQAQTIAEITGKAVLCPALGRVIPAKPERPEPASRMAAHKALQEAVDACEHRGEVLRVRSGCKCEIRRCAKGKGYPPGEVSNSDCLECVKL